MLLVHGSSQSLVRATILGREDKTVGVRSLCALISLNCPDQPHLAAPPHRLPSVLTWARLEGFLAPAAMSVSGKRPTDWLLSLTSGLPSHYGLAWWPGLWSEPGCCPHTSASLFAQVIWGGPWLLRPLALLLHLACDSLSYPNSPAPVVCWCWLLLFVVGFQWSFRFSSKAKDFLSLACLSMLFCFLLLLCPRSCCALGGFLRGTMDLCMGAGVYLQLWDLRKHRVGEGRVLHGIELPLISWQEENFWVQEM